MSSMTTRLRSQLLTTRWLSTHPCQVLTSTTNMCTILRSATLLLRNTNLSLTLTHTLAPLANLCCRECLYSTPKLKLVPLTLTRVWRNEPYTLLSYGQLGLHCPKVLGSLTLGQSRHSCSILALVLKLV